MRLLSLRSVSILLMVLMLFSVRAERVHAQGVSASQCLTDVAASLATELERYRVILFGLEKAEESALGSVRRASDNSVWMKVDSNTWRSRSQGYEGTMWSDILMDQMSVELPPHRGLFEVKQSLTSEIIPGLVQSIRALQCRTKIVCRAAELSRSKDAPVVFLGTDRTEKLKPPGCLPPRYNYPAFPSCKVELKDTEGGSAVVTESSTIVLECDAMRQSLLAREFALLKLAVYYDASTRSVRQLAGLFDLFLTDFRFPLLQPISEAVNLLGQLNRISCFLSQCDE